ncbi:unnamed protein product [Adineta ricciae]|uniref:VWFA domain-containing protein n=1 Tax=Adineta ricciae TaxID=249248 RepID=A0A816ENN5_ADIRI|nr:unnamed protein product [Adineta ricciae]CAF1655431.1 unnamed protein product [Adineta ricciae]
MNFCGCGTNFSAAFQKLIEALEEIDNHPDRDILRQTIVFMTDGYPQEYPTEKLQQLRAYRTDNARGPNSKSLIHKFWTVALGDYNKEVMQKINQKMQGDMIDIRRPEELEEAYAQIAEIM